jgi:hypothetical protein
MKMYNISKGQLTVVQIFSSIGWFFTLEPGFDYGNGFSLFLAFFIPCALIFYTIGWKNQNVSKILTRGPKIDLEN